MEIAGREEITSHSKSPLLYFVDLSVSYASLLLSRHFSAETGNPPSGKLVVNIPVPMKNSIKETCTVMRQPFRAYFYPFFRHLSIICFICRYLLNSTQILRHFISMSTLKASLRMAILSLVPLIIVIGGNSEAV